MSTINFNGPVKINGTGTHIGDNYYYSSPADFYNATSNVNYTDTEKELVALIYDNAPTEEERQQILTSLREIKENGDSVGYVEKKKQNWDKIKEFLNAVSTEIAAKIIVELSTKYFENHTT